jgi:transcriptional regulator GlxA family with amidase domain
MLVFMKRRGEDRQLSSVLTSQSKSDKFEELHSWIAANLDLSLSVGQLARQAGMSVRNFSRAYTKAMGETPSSFVRRVRIEAAVRALTNSRERVSQIAYRCGFGSEERMRRAFVATFGVSPTAFRQRGQPQYKPEKQYAVITANSGDAAFQPAGRS